MVRHIFFMSLIFLTACSANKSTDISYESNVFTSVNNDKAIVMQSGTEFQINLQSNPTTGFSWAVDATTPSVVTILSKEFNADSSDRVGVPGKTTWNLIANQVGTTLLHFSYKQQWGKNVKPSRVVTFEVDVR